MEQEIQQYASKVDREVKRVKKIAMFITAILVIFSFSLGYYISHQTSDVSFDDEQLLKFEKIYRSMLDDWYYADDFDDLEQVLIDDAIDGMLNNVDEHTRYTAANGPIFESSYGIGISIVEYREYFLIEEVVSSSAIDIGLKKGQILKEVDGVSLSYKNMDELSELLEGKSKVDLKVLNENEVEPELLEEVPISDYNKKTVFYSSNHTNQISYIKINEFAQNTKSQLENALENIEYENIILDLRDNPGGFINSVVDVADLFLSQNNVVLQTKDGDGNKMSFSTKTEKQFSFSNIHVMINRNSASGAEALAASLSENLESSTLFGETTFGKGSAQKSLDLGDDTQLIYTYALWYTKEGVSIEKEGISPQIEYDNNEVHTFSLLNVKYSEGDYGVGVEYLQDILKKIGYHTSSWSHYGYFDSEVITAIESFQTIEGIDVNGELDTITKRHLFSELKDNQIEFNNNKLQHLIDNVIGS